jgi:hypothetical protein
MNFTEEIYKSCNYFFSISQTFHVRHVRPLGETVNWLNHTNILILNFDNYNSLPQPWWKVENLQIILWVLIKRQCLDIFNSRTNNTDSTVRSYTNLPLRKLGLAKNPYSRVLPVYSQISFRLYCVYKTNNILHYDRVILLPQPPLPGVNLNVNNSQCTGCCCYSASSTMRWYYWSKNSNRSQMRCEQSKVMLVLCRQVCSRYMRILSWKQRQ